MNDTDPPESEPIAPPLSEADLERVRRETEPPAEHDTDPAPADPHGDTLPPPSTA